MIWWERWSCKAVVALLSCLTATAAQPVLVELFTSEGCSSCPPADALLQTLERGQLIPGVTVIGLSEHVDYWNHLGWSDPFSSAQMTARQQAYAARLRKDGPYTPQMVVDGVEEFVGSDGAQARRAIALAAGRPKLEVTAELVDRQELLHVAVPASSTAGRKYFVAVVYDPDPSAVARGENSGRRLTHVSVVKSLKRSVGGRWPQTRVRCPGAGASEGCPPWPTSAWWSSSRSGVRGACWVRRRSAYARAPALSPDGCRRSRSSHHPRRRCGRGWSSVDGSNIRGRSWAVLYGCRL